MPPPPCGHGQGERRAGGWARDLITPRGCGRAPAGAIACMRIDTLGIGGSRGPVGAGAVTCQRCGLRRVRRPRRRRCPAWGRGCSRAQGRRDAVRARIRARGEGDAEARLSVPRTASSLSRRCTPPRTASARICAASTGASLGVTASQSRKGRPWRVVRTGQEAGCDRDLRPHRRHKHGRVGGDSARDRVGDGRRGRDAGAADASPAGCRGGRARLDVRVHARRPPPQSPAPAPAPSCPACAQRSLIGGPSAAHSWSMERRAASPST